MQASISLSGLSGVLEQQRFPGPCCPILHISGEYAVGKKTVSLRTVPGRFSGCSCSINDAVGGTNITARTRKRVVKNPFPLIGSCGTLIQTKFFELFLPLASHSCQTDASRRSPRSFWKQTVDQLPSVDMKKILDAAKNSVSPVLHNDDDEQVPVQFPAQGQEVESELNQRRSGPMLTAIAISLIVLAAPGPVLTNSSLTLSDTASADQLSQLTKAATALEKAVESLPRVRFDPNSGLQVLEKAVTVVTGSTFIDPKALDAEVDALLNGKKDVQEEVQNGLRAAGENLWSTVVDLLTNFNPGALLESGGASITTFLETGAERVAAFELSALLSLGERWLILTPLLVLPMAWEMNRLKRKNEREYREGQEKFRELSGEALLRGEKVKRELERIELRSSLLEAVSSLGKAALEPPRSRESTGLTRRRIKDILERLEDLNPVEDALLLVPEFASTLASSSTPNDALAYVPTSPTVDGDWHLIYVSESTTDASGPQELPPFPGFGMDNIRQKVWQASSISTLTPDKNIPSPSPLLARNTAEIRLGPLGVFQVAVAGSWENLKDGRRAQVSFNTFSARPIELLGNKVSDDVPQLNLSLPAAFQRSAEWAIAYVDDHLRVNRGSRGQLFLFRKIE